MQASAILGLRAIAPIHVGMEDLRGVVDLAIQREKHSQWPVIFASSVKGGLREHAASVWGRSHADLGALFGPELPSSEHSRAGALLVNEMRLLALPVPALNTVYKWITCPEALQRLRRDRRMFGLEQDASTCTLPTVEPDQAISFHSDDPARIFLREYLFHTRPAGAQEESLLPWLTQVFGAELAAPLRQRLLIVSDRRFGHLAQTATAIQPHIALTANKTTKSGALWYEETLPVETLMYMPLACEDERLSQHQRAQDCQGQMQAPLLDKVLDLFAQRPYFRLGANETTGMGWFEVHICRRQQ